MARRPRKPDVGRFVEHIDLAKELYVTGKVMPYLQTLLDRAQSRTRRPLSFCSAMGVDQLDFGEDPRRARVADAFDGDDPHRIYPALARRFPELVEFLEIVEECRESLGYCVDDMKAAVPPRSVPCRV